MQPATVEITPQERFNASTYYHVTIRSSKGVTDVRNKIYADFEDLHRALNGRYTGVPALPAKKGSGDKHSRVQETKRGLQMFINSLLARLDTAGDKDVCRFINLDAATVTHGLTPQQPQNPSTNAYGMAPAQPHAPLDLHYPPQQQQQQAPYSQYQQDPQQQQPVQLAQHQQTAMPQQTSLPHHDPPIAYGGIEEVEEYPPAAPPGLEGYMQTAAPPGYEEYSMVDETRPISPQEDAYTGPTTQFSPTPLPAAMTPDHTPGPPSSTLPASTSTFSPTPMPQAASPITPSVPANNGSAIVAPPPRGTSVNRAAVPGAAPERPKQASERVLSPGAYEGQYVGSDEDIVVAWINDLIGENCAAFPSLQDALKSGVVLCNVVNKIQPGTIKKVQSSTMPFPQRENIKNFCDAARELGVPDRDNFTTADLFDNKNFKQVIVCIFSLARQCYYVPGYSGPCIGKPEMAKAGAAKESKFGEVKADALWGKANGAYTAQDGRPSGASAIAANNPKASFSSPLRP